MRRNGRQAYTVGNIKIGLKERGTGGFGADACDWS
jgi:hypothetical protein